MPVSPRVFLAVLVLAAPALSASVRVDVSAPAPDGRIAVAWELPASLEESELLVEVDGGPRVRLTDELRVRHASVLVRLPALAGVARFVVRAGGEGLAERDVGFSERFRLDALPLSGRPPVLARASRSCRAAGTEWWSDRPAFAVPAPASGLSGPLARGADVSDPLSALPPPRAGEGMAGNEDSLLPRLGNASRPAPSPFSRPPGAFSGAPVPLRN